MLNEPVLSEVEGVKHLAIECEILRCAPNDTLCFEIFSKDVIYQKCQENATFLTLSTIFAEFFKIFQILKSKYV